VKVNDIASPSGTAVKFPNLGDKVSGTIAHIGDPWTEVNKFNGKEETSVRVLLDVGADDNAALYVRTKPTSQMARAIADAIKATGNDEMLVGGKLTVQYFEDEDTGKPQPMKKYRAKYEAPAAGARVDDWDAAPSRPTAPDEEEPF
jgi:hypothetical protein